MLGVAGGNPRPPALSDNPGAVMTVFTFQRYVRQYFILVFPAFCAKYAVDIRDIWLQ